MLFRYLLQGWCIDWKAQLHFDPPLNQFVILVIDHLPGTLIPVEERLLPKFARHVRLVALAFMLLCRCRWGTLTWAWQRRQWYALNRGAYHGFHHFLNQIAFRGCRCDAFGRQSQRTMMVRLRVLFWVGFVLYPFTAATQVDLARVIAKVVVAEQSCRCEVCGLVVGA